MSIHLFLFNQNESWSPFHNLEKGAFLVVTVNTVLNKLQKGKKRLDVSANLGENCMI